MEKNANSINIDQLFDIYLSKSNPIVDVRTPLEHARCHIPNTINIPIDILLKRHILYLNKEFTYYMICKDGSRSLRATNALLNLNYMVVNVEGGMEKWKGPIERDRGF